MVIAGTGHRPPYLKWGYAQEHPLLDQLKSEIARYLLDRRPEYVVSGFASGFDLYLAEVCVEEKIPLYGAFVKNQDKYWPEKAKEERRIIAQQVFDYVEFEPGQYLARDREMVRLADELVALYNPKIKKGGTVYTVNYAKEQNVPVLNFWDSAYEGPEQI